MRNPEDPRDGIFGANYGLPCGRCGLDLFVRRFARILLDFLILSDVQCRLSGDPIQFHCGLCANCLSALSFGLIVLHQWHKSMSVFPGRVVALAEAQRGETLISALQPPHLQLTLCGILDFDSFLDFCKVEFAVPEDHR